MTREVLWKWAPAALLVTGAILTVGMDRQQAVPLRSSLAETLPSRVDEFTGTDITLSEDEVRVAGVSNYVLREYTRADAQLAASASPSFSVYVGYYESQTQGSTIHSPKNCLPGAGWEALQSQTVEIATPAGVIPANRYLLRRGDQQALVVYWYQGRGRVEADEYLVKAQLLRDAAFRGRTEEALVRIVVPITSDEGSAYELAQHAAARIVVPVDEALPV